MAFPEKNHHFCRLCKDGFCFLYNYLLKNFLLTCRVFCAILCLKVNTKGMEQESKSADPQQRAPAAEKGYGGAG